MGIKAPAIVLNLYLHAGIHALEPDLHLGCVGVFLNVAQAFLDYPEDGDLN